MPKGLKPVRRTNSKAYKAQEKQSSPSQPLTQSKRNAAFKTTLMTTKASGTWGNEGVNCVWQSQIALRI